MSEGDVIELVRQGFYVALQMAGVPLLAGLGIGLLIALFQALTQIQEMTLTFIPKILVIVGITAIMLPTMFASLKAYALQISDVIVGI